MVIGNLVYALMLPTQLSTWFEDFNLLRSPIIFLHPMRKRETVQADVVFVFYKLYYSIAIIQPYPRYRHVLPQVRDCLKFGSSVLIDETVLTQLLGAFHF